MRRACIRTHVAVAGGERRHLTPKSRSMTHGLFHAKRRRPHRPLCSIREALKRESEKFEKSEREHLAALAATRAQGRRRS